MKLAGFSTAILLASCCAASAADLPVKYKAPPPALWSWSGLYGGVNAGYSFGRDTVREYPDLALPPAQGRVLPSGAIFGAQLGYNWQMGRFVWGLEGDLQWSGQRDTACGGVECFQNWNQENAANLYQHDVQWFSTARGRVGLANADTLLYLTGGAAWAGVRETTTVVRDDLPSSLIQRHVLGGWALGGGIEGRLSQAWTVKFEYLHLEFKPSTVAGRVSASSGNFGFDFVDRVDSRVTDNIVRIGLNYRLLDGSGTGLPQPDPAMTAWRWSGLYAGLNGGYGAGNTSFKQFYYFDPAAAPLPGELTHYTSSYARDKASLQGALAGGQIGYAWQLDHIVFGLEGDAAWSGQKDTVAYDTLSQKFNWFATARARVGWAQRGYLLYVTGGAAFAEIGETDVGLGTDVANFKLTKTGWVAGAGLEAWLTGRWTGKIEYLHADLGNMNNTFNYQAVVFGTAAQGTQSTVRNDLIRIGLNYKLMD
ncbi:outer membrane protein [Bradyrhizobium betae]|uniref:Porin family protein n=1 Tax=Bradyrhizobium betae TaxID=244734 RepID=A0A5P6NYH4_9BRAD|nr:outer membrane beta-barrel protein [Bradyrhizobium betae]MCS3725788.1 outer membrane immunogenic protein [Bradyrhizobium betae]QFI70956.1 porin family protein [Bradyrhizobium betae]